MKLGLGGSKQDPYLQCHKINTSIAQGGWWSHCCSEEEEEREKEREEGRERGEEGGDERGDERGDRPREERRREREGGRKKIGKFKFFNLKKILEKNLTKIQEYFLSYNNL